MKPLKLIALAIAASLALAGCSTTVAESDKFQIVASTNVWGDIAQSIGGDLVHVTSIISDPNKDPHSYEASARDELAVKNADLVVVNDAGYDDFMERLINASGANPHVFRVNSSATSVAPGTNVHFWYSLRAVGEIADDLAAALGHVDEAHAADYQKNLDVFKEQLTKLSSKAATIAANHPDLSVFATESLAGLMLTDLNIKDITPKDFRSAIENETDVSVKAMAAAINMIESKKVAAVILNEQTSNAQIDKIVAAADDAGVPVIGLSELLPAKLRYIDWMDDNLKLLDESLPTPK